jgi:hypothetical protein
MAGVFFNNTVNLAIPKPRLVDKIYIWSLIVEPLLYFVVASGGQATGIPFSLSRLLQIIVLLSILGKLMINRMPLVKVKMESITFNNYFLIYLIILIVSSLLGFLLFGSYNLHFNEEVIKTEESVPFLKSKYMRPVFDLFLLIYYYFYFIILAPYFIKNKEAIRYFFSIFITVLYFVLLAGFVDLASVIVTGEALIKRHLGESTDVGFRFHSIAGEPRDAFVYLAYSFCIISVSEYLFSSVRNKRQLEILIIAAMILTQSASGILGFLIGGFLTLVYFLMKKNIRAFYFLFLFSIISAIAINLVSLSPRLQLYVEEFSSLYEELKGGGELPYILLVQSVNFLPFWGMYNQLLNFNLYQFLFGSGLSSVAYYNINYIGDYSYSNPNSQLTRLIFDGGFIGFLFYLFFLVAHPINFFEKRFYKVNFLGIISFFMLTGAALSHRSLVPLIFLGVISAVSRIHNSDLKNINHKLKN